MRIDAQSAFVLHRYPHGETSLIIELFTREHGRVGAIAKGARRTSSDYRSILGPFQSLIVAWSGRGELATLVAAEPGEALGTLEGEALLCGFYLNELLLRLVPRHDPNEALFDAYRAALTGLAGGRQELALRLFEKRLLQELGYGLMLDQDERGSALLPDLLYVYVPEAGPRVAKAGEAGAVRGATLLGLAREEIADPQSLQEAKLLLRGVLARHMGHRPLHTRALFRTIKQHPDGL